MALVRESRIPHKVAMFTGCHSLSTARLLPVIAFFGQLYFFVPVMTPYLLQRSLSIAEIAGLQTTLLVALLFMEIPTGLIADRFGHVWSYRLSLIVLAGGEFLFLFARNYPTFLLIQVITGTGFALGSGSVDAILYDSLPNGDRTRAMQKAKGMLGAAAQTGSVVAYSIGGVIAADLTIPRMMVTILMGAMAVTTAAALSFGLGSAPRTDHADGQQSRRLLATAWAAIRENRDLCRLLLLSIATNAFGAHLLVFLPAVLPRNGRARPVVRPCAQPRVGAGRARAAPRLAPAGNARQRTKSRADHRDPRPALPGDGVEPAPRAGGGPLHRSVGRDPRQHPTLFRALQRAPARRCPRDRPLADQRPGDRLL